MAKTGDHRSRAEHDCDRILYSSALRRLAGVTQVVAAGETSLFHNRLTHTLKVAQLAKRLAQDLVRDKANAETINEVGLDPEAAEAAALAHDVGHPPFGHVAEAELQRCCDGAGIDGFEGNAQSFRVVTRLAPRHYTGDGLDLSHRTLCGILKYPWLRDPKDKDKNKKWGAYRSEERLFNDARDGDASDDRSPEAEIMDWADDISYALHDLEDFYRAGILPLNLILSDPSEGSRFLAQAATNLANQAGFEPEEAAAALEELAELLPRGGPFRGTSKDIATLHKTTSFFIGRYFKAASLHPSPPYVRIKKTQRHEVMILKQMTWQYVINNPALASVQQGQVRIVRDLFRDLVKWLEDEGNPRRLPTRLRRIWHDFEENAEMREAYPKDGMMRARVVADYIAFLTEDQAIDLHGRLRGTVERSVLEGWVRG